MTPGILTAYAILIGVFAYLSRPQRGNQEQELHGRTPLQLFYQLYTVITAVVLPVQAVNYTNTGTLSNPVFHAHLTLTVIMASLVVVATVIKFFAVLTAAVRGETA